MQFHAAAEFLMDNPYVLDRLFQQVNELCERASAALESGRNEQALLDIIEATKISNSAPSKGGFSTIALKLHILKVINPGIYKLCRCFERIHS